MTEPKTRPDHDLMTPDDVAALLCITVPTRWRWVAKGLIPEPLRFTSNTSRWRRSAIEKHLDEA
jgi:predicted DNA-binding transcriptional regulator AlpA